MRRRRGLPPYDRLDEQGNIMSVSDSDGTVPLRPSSASGGVAVMVVTGDQPKNKIPFLSFLGGKTNLHFYLWIPNIPCAFFSLIGKLGFRCFTPVNVTIVCAQSVIRNPE